MPGHATETSIQMSGPGINGKITPGKGWSGRLDPEEVRSFASVYSQEQCNAVFVSLAGAYSNPAWITALDVAKVTGLSATLAAKADLVGGLVPSHQLPSYVDDVIEFADFASLPGTGESGKIYVTLATGKTYRWSGSAYVELTDATAVWGQISGALGNQTDLINHLSTNYAATGHTHTFASLQSKPTTLSGYGITDAYPLSGNPSGFLTNIADGSITVAKMANVATGTVFYRKTAGTGVPEVQTLATLKADLGLSGTNTGDQDLSPYLTSTIASSTYVALAGAYGNPIWITSIAWDKLTSVPAAVAALSGTNSGDQTITLTGDVTGAGTGTFATTIANASISLSKMANVSSSTVFYRKTSGAGSPEVQTLATLKADLGLAGTNTGDQDLSAYATISSSIASFVALAGSYSNPSWITSLAWSKLSGVPAAVSALSGTNTGDQTIVLTGDITGSGTGSFAATIAAASVSLSKLADVTTGTLFYRKTAGAGVPELQTLATLKTDLGLTGTNSGDQTITLTGHVTGNGTGSFATTIADGVVTPAKFQTVPSQTLYYRFSAGIGPMQESNISTLKTDLGLTGTNSGDQTIVLTGDVAGTGTGSFSATIAASAVSLAKMASVATGTVFYRKTAGTGAPEVQTLATLKTDLALTGTNSGDQTITLTGDVTGSGTGSFAATIATASVSLAKMANVATGTVFYRKTAGTGVPEVQTLATLKTDLGLTGTNSGDQDLNSYLTISAAAAAYLPLSTTTSFTRTVLGSSNADGLWTNIGATQFDTNTANVFKLENAANRQTFELYSHLTAADNLEGIRVKAVASANFELGTFVGTVGGSNRGLTIGTYDRATPTVLDKWMHFTGGTGEVNIYGGLLRNRRFEDSTTGSIFVGMKYRGTETTPTALLNNDVIMQLLAQGYNGVSIATSAAVQAQAAANFTSTTTPTRLLFNTCDVDTNVSSVRMVITEGGLLSLGPWSTATPLAALATLIGNNGSAAENNTLRFHDLGNNVTTGQVLGKIEFYSGDASAPGVGVKAWIAGVCEAPFVANAGIAFATDTTTGTPTERMRISRNGRVGIGTTDPQTRLELSDADSTTIRLTSTDTTASIGQLVGAVEFFGNDPDGGGPRVVGNIQCAYILTTGATELYFSTNNAGVQTVGAQLSKEGWWGVGTSHGAGGLTSPLDVFGNCVRVRTQRTPASATAAGNQGEWCNDSNYVYVCTATSTWKRAALSTW